MEIFLRRNFNGLFVFVCVAALVLFVSCSGKGGLAGKKAASLKGTYWVEDHKVVSRFLPISDMTVADIYLNLMIVNEEKDLISFDDDYEEYEEIVSKEYDIDKDGNVTIYLYPKEEVLAVKEKEPSTWMTAKDQFIMIGILENDTLTFRSKLRNSGGKRVFTKTTLEELKKINEELKAEAEQIRKRN